MIKRCLAAILIMAMALSMVVYADTVDDGITCVVGNGGKITVEGPGEGRFVILTVFPLALTVSEAVEGDKIYCHDQTEISDGTFGFEFTMDAPSGDYTVLLSFEDSVVTTKITDYVSYTDYTTPAELINTEVKEDDAAGVLEVIENDTYRKDLKFTNASYDVLDGTTNFAEIFMDLIENEMGETGLNYDEISKGVKLFDKAVYVQLLNDDKTVDAFEDNTISEVEDVYGSYMTKDYFTDALEDVITDKLTGRDFATYEEYKKFLDDALVLAIVQEPDGYGNIQKVLKSEIDVFSDDISSSDITESVCKKLAGSDIDTISDLEDEIIELGSTSGSGGSGGGGGGGGIVQIPVTPNVGDDDLTISTDDEGTPSTIPTDIYTDIANYSWAREAIIGLSEKRIVNGMGDNTFYPQYNVKREEFAKIMINAFFADSAENAGASFADASENDWFYSYISAAYNLGIAQGMGDGTFGVGRNITRQDMSVMIYNAAKAAGIDLDAADEKEFDDDDSIAGYAKDAVYALKKANVINGKGKNTFDPTGYATRAEAAVIVYRLLNL